MSEKYFAVGVRVAALRGSMKQSEFADALGVHRNSVVGWESGKSLPSGEALLQMRDVFGADINALLTGSGGSITPQYTPSLRPDEEALLDNYRNSPSDGRERLRQISITAAQSANKPRSKAA